MGVVLPSWTREGDETPAREQRADADATKGLRALYMFSICLAGADDLIHRRKLSRPSVHKTVPVYRWLSGVV